MCGVCVCASSVCAAGKKCFLIWSISARHIPTSCLVVPDPAANKSEVLTGSYMYANENLKFKFLGKTFGQKLWAKRSTFQKSLIFWSTKSKNEDRGTIEHSAALKTVLQLKESTLQLVRTDSMRPIKTR